MAAHPDLRRIRYVTANYQAVQGLRNVAYGAAFVAGALAYAGVPSATWAITAAVWVGLLLNWLIGRYYRRTFGRVEPSGSDWGATPYWARIGFGLGLACVMMALVLAAVPLYAVLGLVGVAWPIGYTLYLYRRGGLRLRPYWAVAGAVVVALSLVILLPLPALAPLHGYGGMRALLTVYLVPWGLAMIVGGVLDHRLLLRTFAPRGED